MNPDFNQAALNIEDDELDDEIAVVRGKIWDNCRDWCYTCKLPIPENETERTVNRCPKCSRVMGFMPKAGIDEYLKTLDPEEREAREHGIWKHLSGLVYKELDRSVHIYEDFPVPKSWMKIESVDPHDARPVHWAFGAVSPEEIEIFGRKVHRIYWWGQLLLSGPIEDSANTVRSFRELNGYSEPQYVILDKKHGEKTQMEQKSWQGELEKAGIKRIRLSHSSPGDVELGHKIVREYLKPQYSSLLSSAKPGMMFAKKGCAGTKGMTNYMFNYQYKEDADKPEEQYKDWCDCVRYAALEFPVYRSPESQQAVIDMAKAKMDSARRMRRVA